MRAFRQVPTQLRSTLYYLGTVVLSQVASFLLLPLITRFLAPDQYGEYVLVLAVASLIGMFGSSWIRVVGFRFYYDAKTAGTTRSFYWSMAVLQATVLALALLVGIVVLPWVSAEFVPLRTLLAAAFMLAVADFQALTQSFVRAEKQAGHYAAGEVGAAAARLAGTAAGLVAGFTDPAFLFLAAGAGSVVGGLIAMRGLLPRLEGRAGLDGVTMRKILVRSPAAMPQSASQWLGRLSDRLVLNAYASTAVVGVYSAGYGLSDRIIGGLGEAVFMMAWPDVLSAWNDGGYARARAAIHRYFQLFLWMTVGPMFALVVFAAPVAAIFLGEAYRDALQVTGWIAFAAVLRGMRLGLTRHFELQKRYAALSAWSMTGSFLHFGLNLLLVPRYQAVGAGMAAVATQVIMTTLYVIIRDRRLVRFPWRDAAMVVGGSTSLAAGVYLTLGVTVVGFVVFASSYALVAAAIWVRRVRHGWSSEG